MKRIKKIQTPIIIFFVILVFSLSFCVSSRTKSTVLAWSKAKNLQEFTEASLNLPSRGVCFSGGGTRAMNCVIGQYRFSIIQALT